MAGSTVYIIRTNAVQKHLRKFFKKLCVYDLIFSEIECAPAPSINQSVHTTPTSLFVNTIVNYTCQAGLRFLDGNHEKSLLCSYEGEWEGIQSTCEGNDEDIFLFVFKIQIDPNYYHASRTVLSILTTWQSNII